MGTKSKCTSNVKALISCLHATEELETGEKWKKRGRLSISNGISDRKNWIVEERHERWRALQTLDLDPLSTPSLSCALPRPPPWHQVADFLLKLLLDVGGVDRDVCLRFRKSELCISSSFELHIDPSKDRGLRNHYSSYLFRPAWTVLYVCLRFRKSEFCISSSSEFDILIFRNVEDFASLLVKSIPSGLDRSGCVSKVSKIRILHI